MIVMQMLLFQEEGVSDKYAGNQGSSMEQKMVQKEVP